ncbi:MAG: MATE family efflux transporter [Chloroflexota bacterium]
MQFRLSRHRSRLVEFFNDPEYYRQLIQFVIPIALQNLVMSSLNMVSVMMIGQLGEASVAGVGLANQMFFLLQLVLFGITSGSAMFTAQLWGKGDLANIRRVLGLGLVLGLSAAGIFFSLGRFFPAAVLGVYSTDPQVIELGGQYLRTFSWGFLFVAVTFVFAAVMRSTGNVKTPMLVSVSALALNSLGSYLLIFGKLGFPALGVQGAAISNLAARAFECSVLVGIVYLKRLPIALRWSDLRSLDLSFIGAVFRPMLPVILNETFWSFGITAYNVVYARIGTEAIAAMNIVSPIENMAFVLISGIANATAILVGNRIGAGEEQRAYRYAGRSLALVAVIAVIIGSQVWLWSGLILSVYRVSPQVIENARRVLGIMAVVLCVRGVNSTIVVGILRAGGDTRFSFVLDGLIIWIVGVPMAFLSAFVFHLPIYWVYFSVMSEEFLKCGFGLGRYFSRKWIHNLAQTV